jgi:hypothetical protein
VRKNGKSVKAPPQSLHKGMDAMAMFKLIART